MSVSAQVTIESALRETPTASKRRRYSIAEKRQMVEESFQTGTSVASGASPRGQWQSGFRLAAVVSAWSAGANTRAAQAVELLPVTISDSPAAPAPLPAPTLSSLSAGTIQLQLPLGRLRIEGVVDPDCLRVVLNCLLA